MGFGSRDQELKGPRVCGFILLLLIPSLALLTVADTAAAAQRCSCPYGGRYYSRLHTSLCGWQYDVCVTFDRNCANDYPAICATTTTTWTTRTTFTEPSSCTIIVVRFHYDAAGNDHYNLNGEYFVLGNRGRNACDMTAWKATDFYGHTFIFPYFVLKPRASVTIYTGSGTDTRSRLYWGSLSAIWNNDGDTLSLYDASGRPVLSYSY